MLPSKTLKDRLKRLRNPKSRVRRTGSYVTISLPFATVNTWSVGDTVLVGGGEENNMSYPVSIG